jgi:GT2 family glycosyltransferase
LGEKKYSLLELQRGNKIATIIVLTSSLSSAHTRECLESLERETKPPYEVFVLRDDRKSFNFSHDNNRIMRIAEGKYIVLLNDDCIVHENWLEKMVSAAEKGKDIGIVGAVLYNPEGSVQTAGENTNLVDGIPFYENDTAFKFERDTVIFALVLFKRELIEKIGFLDERFVLGYDDHDYCLRARRAGFRIVMSEATATHFARTSSNTLSAKIKKRRGWLVYTRKYGRSLSTARIARSLLWYYTYPARRFFERKCS